MAAQGVPVGMDVMVPVAKEEVLQRRHMIFAGQPGGCFDGVTAFPDGISSLHVHRKYVPTWTIVLGILGAIFL